ncbi:MAG TPA: hypothetical protein PKO28_00950 [Bacilli bacterium]|nr:hypothetical protein [Bacilli bacterium]HPS18794.1 hypothetical protein [Bacilli bacterium]
MNKKLLSVVLSATCVIALAACGPSGSNDDKVLADPDHATYCIAGPSQTTVGGASIAWDYSEAGVMTASSRNDLKAVSPDLATSLKDVELSSLYMIKDVVIGATAAGYNKVARLENGDLVMADGALTIKAVSIVYDAEDDVYSVDEWLPSPEHYGETLTPDLYWAPGHNATPDEDGLDHNSDAVVVGGAGTYTLVLARYAAVNEAGSTLGIGLVQQEANPDGQQVTAIVPEALTSLGVIGSFAASSGWTVEVPLVKNNENVWEGSIEAAANDEFKVRANGAWTYAWGFSAVTSTTEGIVVDASGNIKAVAAGTYSISIVAPAEISVASSALTSFEIAFEAAAVNPLAAVYEADIGAAVEFDGIYLGKYGTLASDVYVGNGDLAVDVYNYAGVTLPEGIAVGDKVHVVGVAAAYKGLVEVTPTTITLAPEAVVAEVTTVALTGTWGKLMLSRPATVTGTVKAVVAITGTANVTAVVTVGTVDINVYIKKSAGLDYVALNTAFATAGASISLKGNVAIYDGAATVDYATSTGYQLVNPSVVVA